MVVPMPQCSEDTSLRRPYEFQKRKIQPQFSWRACLDHCNIQDGEGLLHFITQSVRKRLAARKQCSAEFDTNTTRHENDLDQNECCLNLSLSDGAAHILTEWKKKTAQFLQQVLKKTIGIKWLPKMKKSKENEIGGGLENLKDIKSVKEFLVKFHHCKPEDRVDSKIKIKEQDQINERKYVESNDRLASTTKTNKENAKTEACQIETEETCSSLTEAKTDKPQLPRLDHNVAKSATMLPADGFTCICSEGPMLTGNACDNVPFCENPHRKTSPPTASQEQQNQRVQSMTDSTLDMADLSSAAAASSPTTQYSQAPQIILQTSTSFYSSQPIPARKASSGHSQASQNNCRNSHLSYSDLIITNTGPKSPEFVTFVQRLKTFASWPSDHHMKKENLAKAGFFYVVDSSKEQINKIHQKTVCKLCMDKEMTVVFLPCEHLVSCSDCASGLSNCPTCHKTVQELRMVIEKQNELDSEQKSSSDVSNQVGNNDLLTDLTTKHDFKIRPVVISVYMQPNKPLTKIGNIRWSFLKEEKWRLATFAKYPHNAPKSAALLAANGFAYIGSGKGHDDKVICYFCCHTKEGWCWEDDIQEIHKILSSECPMVTGNTGNNVPYHELPSSSNLFQNLANSHKETSAISNNENKTQVNQNDIQTDSVIDHSQGQQNQRGLLLPSSTRSVADLPSNDQRSTKDGVSRTTQFGTSTYVTPLSNGQVASRQVTTTTKNVVNNIGTTSTISSTATVPLPSQEVRQDHAQISSPNNARSQKGINSSSLATTAETANSPVSQTSHTSQQNPRSSNANSQTSVNTASSVETAQLSVAQAPQTGPTNSNPSQPTPAPSTTSAVNSSTATVNPSNGSGSSSAQNSPATAVAATTPITNQTSTTVSSGSDQRSGSSGPTYNDLGIITERPKRYEYAVITQRLETFELWPREHHLKKEDLAEAGFYYAGYGDCARCFYCGGGLRNWEDEDDVWVEHARWFPRCAFIRQVMGQDFVDKVQDLNKDHDAIPFDMVTTAMGVTRSYFQISTKELPMIMKKDPAVRSVLDMGLKEEDVIEMAHKIKDKGDTLSADKLFEELKKDGKVGNVIGAASVPMNTCQMASVTREDIDQLKEKNNELRQQTVCKICMDKEVTIVFLPCGHLVSCSDCASAMKDCPVCRVTVKGIVRAFLG